MSIEWTRKIGSEASARLFERVRSAVCNLDIAMTRLIHLSDLHFGALDAAPTDALPDYLRSLTGDVVVVSGDLTQRARPDQFSTAVDFLRRLGPPIVAVAGNHDVPMYAFWERFAAPLRRYRKRAQPFVLPGWSGDGVFVGGLESARPFVPVFRGFWKDGRLTSQQISQFQQLRSGWQGGLAVAVVHHPLIGAPGRGDEGVLVGRDAAAERLVRAGVDVVLSGHLHASYSGSPPGQPGLLCVLAGTPTSSRRRHGPNGVEYPNAFNRLIFRGGDLVIEVHEYAGRAWRLVSRVGWEKSGGAWMNKELEVGFLLETGGVGAPGPVNSEEN